MKFRRRPVPGPFSYGGRDEFATLPVVVVTVAVVTFVVVRAKCQDAARALGRLVRRVRFSQ